MSYIYTFLFEWKHFIRSPFKVTAVFLYAVAAIYGLHRGAELYEVQTLEIENVEQRVAEDRSEILENHFQTGDLQHSSRSWINYGEPYWAMWYASPHKFKHPSPSMVYSIGQSEQYGFYKRVSVWSSPYDADLTAEISNPERIQTGTLDFSFALIFLSPLVLLVLCFNVKSSEYENGLFPIISVQVNSATMWVLSRVGLYVVVLLALTIGLIVYGATLTNVLTHDQGGFYDMIFFALEYIALWAVLFAFLLVRGTSILGNALSLAAVYLCLAVVVPAAVHQVLSIDRPANLMTEFIDVREKRKELFDKPDSVLTQRLTMLFPEILESPVFQDSTKIDRARGRSSSALVNELRKNSIVPFEHEMDIKNATIESTFWFNPVTRYQNKANRIAKTHFDDYKAYRNSIQASVDRQIKVLISDTWNARQVDQQRFEEYSDPMPTPESE